MGAADQAIADAIIAHAVDLLRLDASARAQVLATLADLQRQLVGLLAEADLAAPSRAAVQALLDRASTLVERYYAQASGEVAQSLHGAAVSQGAAVAAALRASVEGAAEVALPTAPDAAALVADALIQGAPSAQWWGRQAADVAFRFAAAVRQGIVANETNGEIIARVRGPGGVMDLGRRNAEALVRTSVQSVAADARRSAFLANQDVVIGIRQVSTLDGRTTPTCIAYSDAQWSLPDFAPINGTTLPYNGGVPRHWGCRSVEIALTKTFADLGVKGKEPSLGMRAAEGGPVPADMSFEQWLDRRTVAQQDEQLGVGRAQLWREGKITLNQLLDQSGNPLTTAELVAKYGP